ncbi:uncharacterized protein ARMOST_14979 [Armillaria ostoyae]|uniref:Uncharacterized protein n=1 Tax=Armillaria ostoyae TaxID=47428 RepID=A0A284RS48_ARMOS|nr:uncharacterized protein ARMOST_14979 [Armillaria ostoyae]
MCSRGLDTVTESWKKVRVYQGARQEIFGIGVIVTILVLRLETKETVEKGGGKCEAFG